LGYPPPSLRWGGFGTAALPDFKEEHGFRIRLAPRAEKGASCSLVTSTSVSNSVDIITQHIVKVKLYFL
jgi:hypothetical protein